VLAGVKSGRGVNGGCCETSQLAETDVLRLAWWSRCEMHGCGGRPPGTLTPVECVVRRSFVLGA
jgi:hypothetical protein